MVIQRLLTLMQLPTRLHRCPIVRETDGLAMSSRNQRLNPTQRTNATAIYQALLLLKEKWSVTPLAALIEAGAILKQARFQIDYISVADATTLEPVSDPAEATAVVALIAAFQGEVRLIDNMIL